MYVKIISKIFEYYKYVWSSLDDEKNVLLQSKKEKMTVSVSIWRMYCVLRWVNDAIGRISQVRNERVELEVWLVGRTDVLFKVQ